MENYKDTLENREIFTGEYHDILGHRGEIRFTLQRNSTDKNDPDAYSYEGTCELTLKDADEPVVYKGLAQNLAGSLADKQVSSGGILKLVFLENPEDADKFNPNAEQSFSLTAGISVLIQPATPFAKRAIYGIMDAPTDETGLGGGVWIAWQFTDAAGQE